MVIVVHTLNLILVMRINRVLALLLNNPFANVLGQMFVLKVLVEGIGGGIHISKVW
jgi:hypothetical protein